jgi:hypothetical protein
VAMMLLGVVVLALGLGHADIVAPWRLTFLTRCKRIADHHVSRAALGGQVRDPAPHELWC